MRRGRALLASVGGAVAVRPGGCALCGSWGGWEAAVAGGRSVRERCAVQPRAERV